MKNTLFIVITFYFISCGNNSYEEKSNSEKKDTVAQKDSLSEKPEEQPEEKFLFDLELFTNMEVVPFCIPLPLKRYTLDPEQGDKAKFVFVKNDNKDCYIEVIGLLRSDESTALRTYFENSTSEEETEGKGKVLDQKVLLEDKSCYWVTGHWSNFAEMKFIELTFFREEDIVNIYWQYDTKTEGSDHFKFTQEMIKHGSECK